MHIKLDISNWNIKIILSVLIGAGNPELLSTICMLSAKLVSDQSKLRDKFNHEWSQHCR